MIDGEKFLDQPIRNDMKTFDNIRKIKIGQGDDGTTGCLLDYNYFKKHFKMIATDLSEQQVLDTDPKAIGNLGGANNKVMCSVVEEAKEIILDFRRGTVRVL